jgi:O-antigen biosynthesis protein
MCLKDLYHYYLIKRSGHFDRAYYLLNNPDVRKADIDPLWHFVRVGWKEERNPSLKFNTKFYTNHHKDVYESQGNPLVHYIRFGMDEGRATHQTIKEHSKSYQEWIELYDTISNGDREFICSHIESFAHKPLISILMPVYNTPKRHLQEAIESVRAQLYTNWELCIADDCSTQPYIQKLLDKYRQIDQRIKIAYRDENGHISAASNTALSLCSGEFIGLLDHDDILREHALYLVVNEINKFPEAGIIYSDEDKIDESGQRYCPCFKPDWNPDLFTAQNYLCHFVVYHSNLIKEVDGFRKGYEGSQDWDLALRIIEKIPTNHIRHIPYILYHWRSLPGSTSKSFNEKAYANQAQFRSLASHFNRIDSQVEIIKDKKTNYWRIKYPVPKPAPMASIIIPTKNGKCLLSKCIESIKLRTSYPNYEILIINNHSDEKDSLKYLNLLNKDENIRVLDYRQPFNYSAINNYAASQASGEILVLLNNDVEIITNNWLYEMVGQALRKEIGAVGALMYYPNGTIQHAGVVLGIGGVAGHIHVNHHQDDLIKHKRALLTQNYSAVTAACLAVKKDIFFEVDGFNENTLKIAFNDIDFCLKILQKGYWNLWTPYVELVHYESATRGLENTPEKISRFNNEANYMIQKWSDLLYNDPAYNLNLSLENTNGSLAFPPRLNKPWLEYESGIDYHHKTVF